jgi:7-dehydrocholesterol reductase
VQRQEFREKDGNMLIWGKKPQYVTAVWGGKGAAQRTSLLLADGWWGPARHFHYVFELTAAWSWCLLANPVANGAVPLFYATFLTILLLNRAKRDEEKCLAKYGDGYKELIRIVPWRVIPGVY